MQSILKKSVALKATLGAALLTAFTSAQAALPAGVGTMFTGLTADFTDLVDTYMYPLLFVVLSAFIVIGWVKRGVKKAS